MPNSKSITFDEGGIGGPQAASALSLSGLDQKYAERLREGDAEAFNILVDRYSADVYAMLCRLTGDRDEAADLVQETFLKALRAVRTFRGDASLKTWLFRIAINESRNRFRWWRRRKREVTFSLDTSGGDDQRSFSELLPDRGESPESVVLRLEREARLRRALRRLAPAYREAIVLRDIEGFSYEEVAASVGANLGTVKSRIARGREELRKMLGDF